MPVYCLVCHECGEPQERIANYEQMQAGLQQGTWRCDCGGRLKRDYASENVTNTFHPTVDLYAKKKASEIRRGKRVKYEKGEA